MTIPITFGPLTNIVTTFWDTNFKFVGLLGLQPCTVTGTNNLVFTPASTALAVTAYATPLIITAKSVAANTGAVTARVGGLPILNVYVDTAAGPVALSGGEIGIGNQVVLVFDASLNSGVGGWHLINSATNIQTLLNSIGSARGDILYRGVAAWAALAPGTSGFILQTKGPGADPVWVAYPFSVVGGNTSAISVGSSPFTYTAGVTYETVYIQGGDVSDITVAGTSVFSQTNQTVRLGPGKTVVVTYSMIPTMATTVD